MSIETLKADVRLVVNNAVADGDVHPEDALAALMSVVATYVAQVDDAALRATYIATVAEMFGTMVSLTRGDPTPGINIVHGPMMKQ